MKPNFICLCPTYDVEDNLEKVKNYFHNHGYFNEYKMTSEIQTVFKSGISARIGTPEKRILN